MTHITEARVVGGDGALTVFDILRAGVRNRARRAETDAAQSTWDSEGGATEEGAPLGR